MTKSCYLISDLHVDHYLGSNTTVGSIKKFLDRHLCQADVISVAGDISDSSSTFTRTIEALAELYPLVLYTHGNHDYTAHRPGESSEGKLQRAVRKVRSQNAHHLDGTSYRVSEGTLVGGAHAAYDFSYAEKHFGLTRQDMLIKWKDWYDGRYWHLDGRTYLDFKEEEDRKLSRCLGEGANMMVTHIGPHAWGIPDKFHNIATGFFYFDGQSLLDAMPSGSVWHFGHTHDRKILDLGNVRLMCNPLGYPGESPAGSIPKEEFVITLA